MIKALILAGTLALANNSGVATNEHNFITLTGYNYVECNIEKGDVVTVIGDDVYVVEKLGDD